MSDDKPSAITFKYETAPHFREVLVEGVYGGVTPRGKIHAYLYQEIQPFPRAISYHLEDDGSLGAERERDVDRGIVRHATVGMTLDRETAEGLREWLDDKIRTLSELGSSRDQAQETEDEDG